MTIRGDKVRFNLPWSEKKVESTEKSINNKASIKKLRGTSIVPTGSKEYGRDGEFSLRLTEANIELKLRVWIIA